MDHDRARQKGSRSTRYRGVSYNGAAAGRGTSVAPLGVRQTTHFQRIKIMAEQMKRFRTRLVTLAVVIAPFAMVTTAIA